MKKIVLAFLLLAAVLISIYFYTQNVMTPAVGSTLNYERSYPPNASNMVTTGASGAAPGSVPPSPQNATIPATPVTSQPSNQYLTISIAVILIIFAVFIALSIIKKDSTQREPDDVEIHRALSSDTRIDILNTLLEGERTPTDISSKLNKSKATIVEHLDKLREADLVEKIEADGRKWVFYKLTPRGKSIIKKGG